MVTKLICQICKSEVEHTNHYWKTHRISEADYYLKYFPRFSKLTGKPLKFKNREFYSSSDFNDKHEMAAWFKANPEEAKTYAVELLVRRRESKKIIYAPCQVELRSLMMPSMIWFGESFENYGEICASVGLKPRFDIEKSKIEYGDIHTEAKIVIDSREQLPFKFEGYQTIVKKLDYGDYSLEPNKFKVNIERKSLTDFVSTLSNGYERFSSEINRSKRDKAYLIVLIESSLADSLSFNYMPHMRYASKISPDFIFHNVRTLLQKYPNLQFLFCNSKKEAAEITLKIFSMKKHPKHIDLQYIYDLKKMI